MPAPRIPLLHVAEGPDRAWALHGRHFLHKARTYASWQPAGTRSAVRSAATAVEELRAEGVYRILTPEEGAGPGHDTYVLHPAGRRDAGGRGVAQPASVRGAGAAPAGGRVSRLQGCGRWAAGGCTAHRRPGPDGVRADRKSVV